MAEVPRGLVDGTLVDGGGGGGGGGVTTILVCAAVGALAGALGPDVIRRLPDRSATAPPPAERSAPLPHPGFPAPVEPVDPPLPPYAVLADRAGLRLRLGVVAAAVLGLLGYARGLRPDLPAFLLAGAVGVVLAWVDVQVHRLPDRLTLPSYPVGVSLLGLAALIDAAGGALLRALLGMLALLVLYLGLALLRPADLGLGDVKLAGVIGLYLGWVGWGHLVLGAFLGFLAGGLGGIVLILTGRATRRSHVPFGPAMLLGALVAVVWGEPLLRAYLGR